MASKPSRTACTDAREDCHPAVRLGYYASLFANTAAFKVTHV
jgi:hypothetical protein